jgi:uncharacterized protein (DUF2345 family)
VAIKKSWSLFVTTAGVRLFAGKGKVQIQAQADNIEASAKNNIDPKQLNLFIVPSGDIIIEYVAKDEALLP